jgi:hypothetical protein
MLSLRNVPARLLFLILATWFVSSEVSAVPIIKRDVADVILPAGSINGVPATFSVEAEGSGLVTFQWYRVEAHYNSSRKHTGSFTNLLAGQVAAECTITDWQPFISRTESIYYSFLVIATDATGMSSSRTATVSISPPTSAPFIFNDLQSTYGANEDQALTLDFGVAAYPLNVFWYHNNILVPELTNAFFTLPKVSLAQEGGWFAVCSNALGMVTSRVANVLVIPAIQFTTAQLGNVTIDLDHLVVTNWNLPTSGDLAGNELLLKITGGQSPFPTTGSWSLDLAGNGSYQVDAGAMPAAAGQWSLTQEMPGVIALKLTGFFLDSTTATLSLLDNRYFELSKQGVVANQHGNWSLAGFEPTYTTLPASATFSIIASSSANFTLSYQWYKDGELLPGKTATTLEINPATRADNGTYTCVVTRSDGKTRTSSEGRLTVQGGTTQKIVYDLTPGMLTFSWPENAHLETKSTLSSPWTRMEMTSPASIPTTNGSGYFRWVQP